MRSWRARAAAARSFWRTVAGDVAAARSELGLVIADAKDFSGHRTDESVM
jgi:hypothetical protein